MGQIMAMARKMSDMQLSDVLQGKSLDVPQFAAMTEAMGRKSLRNAVQGAQAQGQAQQPSLKDKLLAEESAQQMLTMPGMEPQTVMAAGGGLTSIPAPNMESMDMAGGGIIAFDDGGEVPRFQNKGMVSAEDLTKQEIENLKKPFLNYRTPLKSENKAKGINFNPFSTEYAADLINNTPSRESGFTPTPSLASTPLSEDKIKEQAQEQQLQAQQRQQLNAGINPRAGVNPSAANLMQPANGLSGVEDEIAKYSDKYRNMFGETPALVKRDNPFSAIKYEGDSADKTREQGLGAGLMMAASGLFKNPTFAGGLGDAMMALGNQGWITAKEVKAAKKDERDFNLNMTKSSAAFEQGEDEKAYKYAALAQDKEEKIRSLALNTFKAKTDLFSAQDLSNYHKGSLDVQRMQANKPDSGIAMLHALGDPKLMERYNQMQNARNPRLSTVTPDAALKEYNDRIEGLKGDKFKNQFPTFNSYYSSLQQSSAPQLKFLNFEPS
jgi:hypothetical protein